MASRARSNSPLAKFRTDAEYLLLSPDDIDAHLKALESFYDLSGLGIQVSLYETFQEWGNCEGTEAVSGKLGDKGAKVAIYLSDDSDFTNFELQQALHNLLETFRVAWTKEYRNEHGGLTLKASGAEDNFLTTLRARWENLAPQNFSVVYIDIDHFKPINDQCGHAEGNKALRKIYARMHKLARNLKGYSFFDGGDEFILVFPTDNILEISSGMWELSKGIRSEKFGKEELRIGFTAGVAIRPSAEITSNFQKIKSDCEDLTKYGEIEKQKRRGTISFELPPSRQPLLEEPEVTADQFYKLGISLSRCRQSANHPFDDERLNLIIDQVIEQYEQAPDNRTYGDAVSEIVTWFGSTITATTLESSLLHTPSTYESISKHAIAVAVAHGLSRALYQDQGTGNIAISVSTDKSKAKVTLNGESLWGDEFHDGVETVYGTPIKQPAEIESAGLFVGVQIGFDEKLRTPGGNRLPRDFLVDHVRVDVRPKTGGGLPDFWQVALAQVVSCLGNADNILKVLVWGDDAVQTETYKRLSTPSKWSIDEIAHLTGLDSKEIRKVGRDIKTKIVVTKSPEEVLNEIYEGYQQITKFSSVASDSGGEPNDPLPRPMASITSLSPTDGAVCTTAAIAYPIIIDTLRKSSDIRLSKDDAEQEQRELIAFKLKITTPLVNPIPLYLKKQEQELITYAKSVLLNADGIIRKKLEEGNQVTAFIKHLSAYVGHTRKARSTRRACIVVPHVPKDEDTPKPWGLISVWATPRHMGNGNIYLDYAFVWRTVEAFIGLPYSLYGSIRLAEQLLESVREEVEKQGGNTNIHLGELNYVALSLHIGSDQFHTRVAKHIVDLASD